MKILVFCSALFLSGTITAVKPEAITKAIQKRNAIELEEILTQASNSRRGLSTFDEQTLQQFLDQANGLIEDSKPNALNPANCVASKRLITCIALCALTSFKAIYDIFWAKEYEHTSENPWRTASAVITTLFIGIIGAQQGYIGYTNQDALNTYHSAIATHATVQANIPQRLAAINTLTRGAAPEGAAPTQLPLDPTQITLEV
jgi:hypothetical protein